MPTPPFDIATLFTPITTEDVRARIVSTLITLKIPADRWRPGGVASSIVTAVSAVASNFSSDVLGIIKAGFLPFASGGWLQWAATYFYDTSPRYATFASGQVQLTNNGGGVFSYGPGEVTFQNPTSKKTFVNEASFALGAGAPPLLVNISATEAGTASNSQPGTVTKLVTAMLGVDATNLTPILGIDNESDPELRQACYDSLGARSVRGPQSAYAYAIRLAVNLITGGPVNVNRHSVSNASHTGLVTVVLASPSGTPDPTDVAAVQLSILQNAEPQGVTATAVAATPVSCSDSLIVYGTASPGLTQDTVTQAVQDALSAFFATYPIGGRAKMVGGPRALYATATEGTIKAAHPSIYAVDGANDLSLSPTQVAVNATTVVVRLL